MTQVIFGLNHYITLGMARNAQTAGRRDEALRRYRDALNEWEKTGADFRYVEAAGRVWRN